VSGASLPGPQLVKEVNEMFREVKEQGEKQLELALSEARADLRREAHAALDLAVAAVGAAVTLSLLLVTVTFALSSAVPPWVAGLIVSAVALAATAGAAYLGWKRRARLPLARMRRRLERDAKLVKEGGAA
jgi:hypothetical protein